LIRTILPNSMEYRQEFLFGEVFALRENLGPKHGRLQPVQLIFRARSNLGGDQLMPLRESEQVPVPIQQQARMRNVAAEKTL